MSKHRAQQPADSPIVPGDDIWMSSHAQQAQPFDLWTRANVGESWLYPVTPLTWSHILLTFNEATRYPLRGLNKSYLYDIQWVRRLYGRVYYNEGAMAHVLSREYGLPAALVGRAWGSDEATHADRQGKFRLRRTIRRLPALLIQLVDRLRAERELELLFPQIDRWVAQFQQRDLEALSDDQLCDELARTWRRRFIRALGLHIIETSSAMTAFALLERIVTRWCGRTEVALDLISGLPGIYTAEMSVSLWQIARQAQELGMERVVVEQSAAFARSYLQQQPRARPVVALLEVFLARYGHHCAYEEEWLHPRWAEEPEQVIAMVASYLRAVDHIDPLVALAERRRQHHVALEAVEAHLGSIRHRLFRRLLAKVQHAVLLRDNSKHYLMKLALPACCIYRMLGRRWVIRGWLSAHADLFFLTIPEIETVSRAGSPGAAGLDLPALIAERRKAYHHWFRVEAPQVAGADGRPHTLEETGAGAGMTLAGLPASGGRVRGVARIVHTAQEVGRIQPGDILVARSVDPGWTPLFPLIGGLVLEIGGQLSHAILVAREYGIPAIVNVAEAMQRIHEGQVITLDGLTGHIWLESSQSSLGI